MKKIIAILLATALSLFLFACTSTQRPRDKVEEQTVIFIQEYLNIELGNVIKQDPTIDIVSVVDVEENQWALIGTATAQGKEYNAEISAKFGVVATYDTEERDFIFSKVEFDDWK